MGTGWKEEQDPPWEEMFGRKNACEAHERVMYEYGFLGGCNGGGGCQRCPAVNVTPQLAAYPWLSTPHPHTCPSLTKPHHPLALTKPGHPLAPAQMPSIRFDGLAMRFMDIRKVRRV